MLTWDEAKAAVQEAQTTTGEDFERHLADRMVQGVLGKLIDDYVDISMRRYLEGQEEATIAEMQALTELISHECAIFMTGVQVGWYLGERAYAT